LHDCAKASARLRDGTASPSKLRKVWPPIVMLAGQVAGLDGVTPCSSRSAVVTTLKVDPGGYWPVSAMLGDWLGGLTAATTSPVEARMATSAAGWATALRACSPALWSAGSRVVCTGAPGLPLKLASVDTTFPAPSTTWMLPPGRPANSRS